MIDLSVARHYGVCPVGQLRRWLREHRHAVLVGMVGSALATGLLKAASLVVYAVPWEDAIAIAVTTAAWLLASFESHIVEIALAASMAIPAVANERHIALWLTKRAAGLLPRIWRTSYEEEWINEVTVIPGSIAPLLISLQLLVVALKLRAMM